MTEITWAYVIGVLGTLFTGFVAKYFEFLTQVKKDNINRLTEARLKSYAKFLSLINHYAVIAENVFAIAEDKELSHAKAELILLGNKEIKKIVNDTYKKVAFCADLGLSHTKSKQEYLLEIKQNLTKLEEIMKKDIGNDK